MVKESRQEFITRNRAPRVHIAYKLAAGEPDVEIPFVMGVLADLSGNPAESLPEVKERKFLEINAENLDDRLKAAKPRVTLTVPNTLTGEGNLSVELTFESMDDFLPDAIAQRVEPLRKLFEARTQLDNLLTWIDGKGKAEELLSKLFMKENRTLLQALVSGGPPAASGNQPTQQGNQPAESS